MQARRHRRREGSASVNVHVRDLSQVFNSLDPSPFWDRDLDHHAAEFIEDEFSEQRSAETWHLNVHTLSTPALADDLKTAIESYYTRLAASARRELAEHRRIGHIALVIGLSVLLLSMSARELLIRLVDIPRALDEGLIILAWLALWRPAEMLAYEWVPLWRKRRLYERLARMRVVVKSNAGEVPRSI